jgi:Ca2+-binding EF-hand superfamily protein
MRVHRRWRCLINSIAGELSPLQLRKILVRFGIDMPPDLWDEVLGKLDKDRDGMVQIGEFMQGMKHAVADVKVTTQPAN